jgi:rod shape determining protein RodA
MNWFLILIISLIASFGFIMLYSAANCMGAQLCVENSGSLTPWALPQMLRFGLGLLLIFALTILDTRLILKYAYPIYFITLILLIYVEMKGHIGMGAQRWIKLWGFQLQPSEIMKLSLVVALARFFHASTPEETQSTIHIFPAILLIMVPTLFVLKQPDLGTAITLLGLGGLVLFIAGVQWWKFAIVLGLFLIAAPLIYKYGLHDYQRARILIFLDPASDPTGSGYNILQALIALGSGGFLGKGLLNGTQGYLNFVPEKQTDFIFTMLAEELGMFGGLILLLLYACVLVIGYDIALKSKSQFGKFLALGVTTNFFIYFFINMSMVMGLLPVVGVPLPLISYGGTSMLTIMVGFGLLENIKVNQSTLLAKGG